MFTCVEGRRGPLSPCSLSSESSATRQIFSSGAPHHKNWAPERQLHRHLPGMPCLHVSLPALFRVRKLRDNRRFHTSHLLPHSLLPLISYNDWDPPLVSFFCLPTISFHLLDEKKKSCNIVSSCIEYYYCDFN